MKGMIGSKKEIFGYRRSGGFSANVPYLKWLKECSQIRLDNNQNFVFVYLIHLIRIIKNLDRIF